jgi:hypothetical protein
VNLLSLLTANPEALSLLTLLLAATFVVVSARRSASMRPSRVGARAAVRHHVGAPVVPARHTDPDAPGRARPRAPSTV